MRLVINGRSEELVGVTTLADLLALRGTDLRHVVVALNERCVPRSSVPETRLCAGDVIEILAPMQGG